MSLLGTESRELVFCFNDCFDTVFRDDGLSQVLSRREGVEEVLAEVRQEWRFDLVAL
jgi:hypothetical protein